MGSINRPEQLPNIHQETAVFQGADNCAWYKNAPINSAADVPQRLQPPAKAGVALMA